MNIDISNAHCGPRIQFPDHAWLRVVFITRNCLRYSRTSECWTLARSRRDDAPATRGESVRLPWASFEMNRAERFFRSQKYYLAVVAAARRRATRLAEPRVKGERTHEERERDRSCARADRVSSESTRNSVSRARDGRWDRHASSCTPPPSRRSSLRAKIASPHFLGQRRAGQETTSRLVAFVRKCCYTFFRRPQSRRDHPLNLSILLSGGKETNQDFLSSGERTGKSPAPNPAVPPQGNVVFGRIRLSRGVASRPSPS